MTKHIPDLKMKNDIADHVNPRRDTLSVGRDDELPYIQGGGLGLHDAALLLQHVHTAGCPVRPLQHDLLRRPHRRGQRGKKESKVVLLLTIELCSSVVLL